MPQVSVTITNVATQANRSTISDSTGRYSFLQVAPGTYSVRAKAAGFSDLEVPSVTLLVDTPSTLNLSFEKMGSVTQTISISAEATQINTTDASLGNAVGTQVITQVPLEGRNVVGLLSLQPGVVYLGEPAPGDPQGDYRSGTVNGGKSDQANVTLDGVDVNDQENHTAFSSVLRVTLDSVQEFRTVTTNAGAEMGRSSGAQVTLVTKSGTNTLHGSLYEFHRNDFTSANSFFNNSSGIPVQKLIRNVFGASLGGPIWKNRAFFFMNYEGRRDASEANGLRIVPTADFRQGIFTYLRNDGSVGKLSPEQVKALDPAHIGADPAVLSLLQQYPLPNDFTQGDTLNTAGYRFNASTPLRWNTYIARLDYQLDSAGKHQLFWRGNLQNDNFVPNGPTSIPQFPGQPPASVFLDNSKGYAIGYTAILSPTLTSNLRYGYTRQGQQQTGVLTSNFVYFRALDPLYALSTGLTRITPTHTIAEDMSWVKGAHSFSFGGEILHVSNNRASFANSYSDGYVNASVLITGGTDLLAPDAADTSQYKWQFANLLGLMTEIDGHFNYDKNGNALPQSAPAKRDFIQNDYEFYAQDSWKATRALTVTYGLRFAFSPPVYEANGIQTSPNIALGNWFNLRGGLAEEGKSQQDAGPITLNLLGRPGTHGLYPLQKTMSPRFAIAYSPQSDSGWKKWLFGGPGRTSIRTGVGMFYDVFGQGLVRDFDATELGFSTVISPPVSPLNPNSSALTAARFTGFYNLPSSLLPTPPPSGFPQTYPNVLATANTIDQNLRAPYTINLDFSIGREFGHGFFVEGAYVGRLSRHSLLRADVAEPTNLRDPKSGMTYFEAATLMSKLARANTDPSKVAAIPFFEDLFPGYAGGGQTATQNLYANYFQPYVYNETTAQQLIDDAGSGCSPCSILGPNAMYAPQFAALATLRSIGSGSYHAMQWSIRKRFSSGVTFNVNYTLSKSMDLGSFGESWEYANLGSFTGLLQNAWNPNQQRAVSDYDTRHLVSAFVVAELPFGKGKPFFGGAGRFWNALIGGWEITGIWRQSSGLPAGVGDGGNWPTDWQITPNATQIGPVPGQHTTKNAPPALPTGIGGPNMFPDPALALAAYDFTYPGQSGQRNGLRGDGFFTIDTGVGKRFTLFTLRDQPHTLQIRAEAFNVTNTVRFDPQFVNTDLGDPANFGKYTTLLTQPRVLQFSARYEF